MLEATKIELTALIELALELKTRLDEGLLNTAEELEDNSTREDPDFDQISEASSALSNASGHIEDAIDFLKYVLYYDEGVEVEDDVDDDNGLAVLEVEDDDNEEIEGGFGLVGDEYDAS